MNYRGKRPFACRPTRRGSVMRPSPSPQPSPSGRGSHAFHRSTNPSALEGTTRGRRFSLSPWACHYPQVWLPFLNPKGIVSSSPGLRAASYPGKTESRKRPTPTGLRLQARTGGRNPVGVGAIWPSSPRVARCSQPWALRRNPFGIRLLDDATCGECSAPRERAWVRGKETHSGRWRCHAPQMDELGGFSGRANCIPRFG
jgi:hypothetical protein